MTFTTRSHWLLLVPSAHNEPVSWSTVDWLSTFVQDLLKTSCLALFLDIAPTFGASGNSHALSSSMLSQCNFITCKSNLSQYGLKSLKFMSYQTTSNMWRSIYTKVATSQREAVGGLGPPNIRRAPKHTHTWFFIRK